MSRDEQAIWDRHWETLGKDRAAFGAIASLYRKSLLSRAVRHFLDKYFVREGFFVEAGSGTGQASGRISSDGRRLVALDFSLVALRSAREQGLHQHFLCADIRHLPFKTESVAGIWNLGVMEHFPEADGVEILREFGRVLEKKGVMVLFWPPEFGFSRLLLGPIEAIRSRGGRTYRFFPDEVNRLRSLRQARATMRSAGLEPVASRVSLRDLFVHVVAIARKASL